MDKPYYILSESTHWLTHLGEPVLEVPRGTPIREGLCPNCRTTISTSAKGFTKCKKCESKVDVTGWYVNATREPDLSDARRYGLFPSVSKMASYGDMPFEIINFKCKDTIQFIMDQWDKDNSQWWANIKNGLKDHLDRFANIGTEIHGHIQKAMEGIPYTGESKTVHRCVSEIFDWEQKMGITGAVREMTHCNPDLGLGGTIDFASETPRIIADYKTRHSNSTFDAIKKGNRAYLDYAIIQLCGYMAISKPADKVYVIVVRADEGHPDAGETLFIELTDDELCWGTKCVKSNLRAFFDRNRFYPVEMYRRGECKSLKEIKGE